jgi:enoyl-CoA hydratase
MNADLETGIHIEIEGFGQCYASSDSKEGTSAFLEKRKAEFKGSLKD